MEERCREGNKGEKRERRVGIRMEMKGEGGKIGMKMRKKGGNEGRGRE